MAHARDVPETWFRLFYDNQDVAGMEGLRNVRNWDAGVPQANKGDLFRSFESAKTRPPAKAEARIRTCSNSYLLPLGQVLIPMSW